MEMVVVQEGEEPNDFRALVGDMNCYYSLVKGTAVCVDLAKYGKAVHMNIIMCRASYSG